MPPEAAAGNLLARLRHLRSGHVGFRSTALRRRLPRLFPFDTGERGNGNGGHVYGTSLSPDDKAALVEYLKTL